ncbi:hypothetical protein MP228_011902 [Amoeboaphelidium protococcarum]|nr:hypothetical protein MP228_011902 [Amoeboaphelidium protococcarum]
MGDLMISMENDFLDLSQYETQQHVSGLEQLQQIQSGQVTSTKKKGPLVPKIQTSFDHYEQSLNSLSALNISGIDFYNQFLKVSAQSPRSARTPKTPLFVKQFGAHNSAFAANNYPNNGEFQSLQSGGRVKLFSPTTPAVTSGIGGANANSIGIFVDNGILTPIFDQFQQRNAFQNQANSGGFLSRNSQDSLPDLSSQLSQHQQTYEPSHQVDTVQNFGLIQQNLPIGAVDFDQYVQDQHLQQTLQVPAQNKNLVKYLKSPNGGLYQKVWSPSVVDQSQVSASDSDFDMQHLGGAYNNNWQNQSNENAHVKKYHCPHAPECPHTFSRRHDLLRHMRLHSNDAQYQCSKCGKRFTRKDSLKRHMDVSDRYGGKCRQSRGRVPKNMV